MFRAQPLRRVKGGREKQVKSRDQGDHSLSHSLPTKLPSTLPTHLQAALHHVVSVQVPDQADDTWLERINHQLDLLGSQGEDRGVR